ncbi:MAG: LytTR family DNA-binding domain-containing protein [Hyphomicrobiales bacterium]
MNWLGAEKVPGKFFKVKSLFLQSLFMSVFSVLFIVSYQPLDSLGWYTGVWFKDLVEWASYIMLYWFPIIFVSRVVASILINGIYGKFWKVLLYILIEIVIITAFDTWYDWTFEKPDMSFIELLLNDLFYIFYTFCLGNLILIFWYYRTTNLIGAVTKDLDNLEDIDIHISKKVTIPNDNYGIKMELDTKDIILFKQQGNEVKTYYLKDGQVKSFMTTINLHKEESELLNYGFSRCHQDFMINLTFLENIGNFGGRYFLTLKKYTEPIPVSKTYEDKVVKFKVPDSKMKISDSKFFDVEIN